MILFATDFSALSDAAFDVACALAQVHGARIVVIHVAPMDVVYGEMLRPPSDPRIYLNSLDDRLRRLKPARPNIPLSYELKEGDAASEILRAAEETDCDLIVMGSHGRSGLGRLVLGRVAEGVLRAASCPVLTVKAKAES
jgi:nucleotide-binding universal stress UspA family protein